MKKILSVAALLATSSTVYANPFTAIPEPEMLSLFGLGVAGMLLVAHRRRKN